MRSFQLGRMEVIEAQNDPVSAAGSGGNATAFGEGGEGHSSVGSLRPFFFCFLNSEDGRCVRMSRALPFFSSSALSSPSYFLVREDIPCRRYGQQRRSRGRAQAATFRLSLFLQLDQVNAILISPVPPECHQSLLRAQGGYLEER